MWGGGGGGGEGYLLSVCLSISIITPLVSQEAELHLDPGYLDQFAELNHVLEALRARDVEPALE